MKERQEIERRSGVVAYLSGILAVLALFTAGSFPLQAQTPPGDPAPFNVILWKLDRGDAAGAEQLVGEYLPQMKTRLESLIQQTDQDFDDLGRFGAVSYKFGPGYTELVDRNRRYHRVFEMYRKRSGDDNLFKRFDARSTRIEGAEYTNQAEKVCGETLDWSQAEKLYELALERLNTSFTLAQQVNDLRLMASIKNNAGSTLIRLGKPDEAIQTYLEGMKYADQSSIELYRGLLRLNLGNAYLWIGQPEKSLPYSQAAWDIFKKLGRGTWEANALMNIGNAYITEKKFGNAWETLTLAVEQAKKSREDRVRGRALLNLGMAGMQMNNKNSSSYVQEALEWYASENGAEVYIPVEREVIQQDGLRMLSQVAQKNGDEAAAEKFMKQYAQALGPDPDRYKALRESPCFAIYKVRPAKEVAQK